MALSSNVETENTEMHISTGMSKLFVSAVNMKYNKYYRGIFCIFQVTGHEGHCCDRCHHRRGNGSRGHARPKGHQPPSLTDQS